MLVKGIKIWYLVYYSIESLTEMFLVNQMDVIVMIRKIFISTGVSLLILVGFLVYSTADEPVLIKADDEAKLIASQNNKLLVSSEATKTNLSDDTIIDSKNDTLDDAEISHGHKSINGFTQVGTAMLNTSHYDAIMARLAQEESSFTFLNSRYWVEYLGLNDQGDILFKLYDLMGFSDPEQQRIELAFYYDIEHLFDNEEGGSSSPENENIVSTTIENITNESPLITVCTQIKCMFIFDQINHPTIDIDKVTNDIIAKLTKPGMKCSRGRKVGPRGRQYVVINCVKASKE